MTTSESGDLPTPVDPTGLLVQLQGLLANLQRELTAVKEERAEMRREIAEIKGVLLGGAVGAGRPLKIRVEDNESQLAAVRADVKALTDAGSTSKLGLIWVALGIAGSSTITGLVVWLLTRATSA